MVALGVTATGEKRLLGLVQTASENSRVIASFLCELGERGFPLEQPLLVVRHRLNVFPELGVRFKTTNLIESVMARLEANTQRVTRWRTSDQKLRCCASALWATERQFRRVNNHRHLPLLKHALQNTLSRTKLAAA